jgi:hypothetical protein
MTMTNLGTVRKSWLLLAELFTDMGLANGCTTALCYRDRYLRCAARGGIPSRAVGQFAVLTPYS